MSEALRQPEAHAGASSGHESAVGHVTGRAAYTDEPAAPRGQLSLYPVQAPHAHARIVALDASAARAAPGVRAVLTAADIPGENDIGAILHDEPLIPDGVVSYHGQAVAWVVAEGEAQARAAAGLVQVRYEPRPARVNIAQALAAQAFHGPPARIECGDPDGVLARAPHRLSGEIEIGGQDHFYLETQASWAEVDSEGLIQISSSTQHPSDVQQIAARVLGLPANRVVCRSLRMGGGFGGKETQASAFAALAALAARATSCPVRIKLSRRLDMQLTGKRHPFLARWEVGFDGEGLLLARRIELYADGGWSCDLSPAVLARAMLHADGAYYCANTRIIGRVCRTHLPSNTAFRGFGGPQGMLVAEEIVDRVARQLGLAPEAVRERNFYRPGARPDRNVTPYGQSVVDNHLPELWTQLERESGFAARRSALAAFNAAHADRKRGIALTPVKFGISFVKTEYNQAGALVHLYTDGSVQLSHGGTEMGQGLHSKMIGVAARCLGISRSRIQLMATSTDKVPNTSATAASSSSDLNGQAVRAACETLLARLAPIAAERLGGSAAEVEFADDRVCLRNARARQLPFEAVVRAAYDARVSLSSTGFYRTPGIGWDAESGRGEPFYYFAYGAAVGEVEVCGYTGVHQLLRVDLLHDVGESLDPVLDRGQIEGGFVQGLGWLTCEELRWDEQGRLLTDAPSTYKIPSVRDVPMELRLALFQRRQPASTDVIFGSKGVGEPPLMLALCAREALRDAIAAFGSARAVPLASPATPEAIYRAIEQVRRA